MNEEELRREYHRRLPDFEPMKDEIVTSLRNGIFHEKIPFSSVHGRVKGFDSFMEKSRNKNLQNPFQEINDIVGIRVICLYLDDVEKIRDVVHEIFEVIRADDKIDSKDVDRFGYFASHIIAKLRNDSSSQESLPDLPFEIQIRTITQDAWAAISHHLFYKQTSQIPKNLERDFQALSALFYVADSHFLWLKNEHSRRGQIQ